MNWFHFAIVAAVTCVVTIALVPPVKKLAFKVDAVDYPSERRVNKTPVPRLGGVAMFGGMLAGLVVLCIGVFFSGWHYSFKGVLPSILGYGAWYPGVALGVLAVFLVGVADDVFHLNPLQKLVGQIAAACIIAASGLLLNGVQNPFGQNFISFGWFAYPITIFYLVAFANIINLIDGLDGLASGITAISATAMFVFALSASHLGATFLCAILVGACLGFLRYNFNPASIFMGDSGSLVLGMCLGVVSLLVTTKSTLFMSLLVPILAAGVPIIDTASAIVRRVRGHQPIQQADNGHIHHRLMREGYTQRKTVLIMWGWTAVLAVCAIVITEMTGLARVPFLLIAAGVSLFFIVKLRLLGPVLQHHYNPRPAVGKQRELKARRVSGTGDDAGSDDERADA